MQWAFCNAERGLPAERQDQPLPEDGVDDSETDGEGWETDSDGFGSEGELTLSDPEDRDG